MKPYYRDDWVTLYHGDCREVLPSLAPVDLVLTDPPYGVGFGYADHDDQGGDVYQAWVLDVLQTLRDLAPVVMLTPGIRNAWHYPPPTWALCWGKPGSPRRSDLGGFNEWEPILMYGKRRIYNDFKHLAAWNNTTPDAGVHPCPKPLRLMKWLADVGCDEGDTILDPFAGSGTTLRAAKDLGRRAIGIEVDESYCEIIVRRLAQEVLDLGEADTQSDRAAA